MDHEIERMEAYLGGQMPSEEKAAFEARLKAEPALAETLLTLAREEAILVEWARVMKQMDRIDEQTESSILPVLKTAGPAKPWFRPLPIAALVASLLVAAGVALWMLKSPVAPASAMAHLEDVQGEVQIVSRDESHAARSGQSLLAGQGLHVVGEESSATVVYPDGTRLLLGADTTLTEISDGQRDAAGKRVVLSSGFLTATVARQPPQRPMILATPHAEVAVLGTKFNLSGGTEVTYVETNEGAVRVTRKSDGQSINVDGGFAASVTSHAEPLTSQSLLTNHQAPRLDLEPYWTGALSPDGETLVTTSYIRGRVDLWDMKTLQQKETLQAHTKRVLCAVFSRDGQTLATGGNEETIHLWDWQTARLRATLDVRLGRIMDLSFSSDGTTLAVLSAHDVVGNRTLSMWDLQTHQQRSVSEPFPAIRWAFSRDGKLLATATREQQAITLWDVDAGQIKTVWNDVAGIVFSMAFSHDGTTLVVDDTSGMVAFRDVSTGQAKKTWQRHGGMILGMVFSADDATLATGHLDGAVRLWDVATARQLAIFESGHAPAYARALAFARDGKSLLAGETRLATSERQRAALQLWDLSLRPTVSKSIERPTGRAD